MDLKLTPEEQSFQQEVRTWFEDVMPEGHPYKGGSIINIASVSTIRPSPGTAAYGAAKAGLVNLGTSLAVEWAPKVRVNALVVGLTQTEQSHLHYGDDEGIAAVGATIPLGRMAVPQDVGNACLFLASPLAAYVSGTNFAVHGGGEKPDGGQHVTLALDRQAAAIQAHHAGRQQHLVGAAFGNQQQQHVACRDLLAGQGIAQGDALPTADAKRH